MSKIQSKIAKTTKITETSLLLVEGKDEENFFEVLLKKMEITGVQILDVGGKDKFRKNFEELTSITNFSQVEKIGFIRDAEKNKARSAFQSICSILKKFNLPIPASPATNGAIQNQNGIKLGIFIMPDNEQPGALEDLCLRSIEKEPLKCIKDYLTCVKDMHPETKQKNFNIPKAKIQTFLAAKTPIVNSLGLGAQKGIWDFEHPCFEGVKHFLQNVYGA